MEQEKILSIIIPTYNMEKYLRKCLDSLIVSDENMQQLEVLVVNDGSKDSSSQIAHEYETRYPQTFKVIDKENGNYGSCINRGLKEATGKYVKVLDADDFFDREVLNSYLIYLCKIDADMILTDYCQVDERDAITIKYKFNLPVGKPFPISLLCTPEIIYRLAHQDITYRKELLHEMVYKQTEGISYTDNEWVFKPLISVNQIVYFPHVLYYYLRGREGQTFDPNVLRKSYDQREKVMLSLVDYYSTISDSCRNDIKTFLKERLIKRLSGFYYFHCIISGSEENSKVLMRFDKHLSVVAKDVYEALAEVKIKFGMRFILIWRKHHDIQAMPLRLYRTFKKIIG